MDKAAESFESTTNVAVALIEMKKHLFDENDDVLKKWRGQLDTVANAGSIIQKIYKITSSSSDSIVTKLKSLSEKFGELSATVNTSFDEMKSLINDTTFFGKVMIPTSILTSYMNDCFQNPSLDALENFRESYHANSPLRLAYDLISYLDNNETNPLKIAIDSENPKTAVTFQKWQSSICRALGQLMFLEAFARGYLNTKSTYNQEKLLSRAHEVCRNIDALKKETLKDDYYWEEIKNFLHDYFANHTNLNNTQKADELKSILDKYPTVDAFYLCVLNEGAWKAHFYWRCPNPDQLVEVRNTGLCNAFVYRSRKGKNMEKIEYDNSQREVQACKDGKLDGSGSPEKKVNEILVEKKLVRRDGLIALIPHGMDVQTRFANSPNHEKGPGWYETVFSNSATMDLIVGLP